MSQVCFDRKILRNDEETSIETAMCYFSRWYLLCINTFYFFLILLARTILIANDILYAYTSEKNGLEIGNRIGTSIKSHTPFMLLQT